MDLSQFSPSSALITVVLLAMAPFVAVMVTSFTKMVVVLSLLRNALGLQQVPPNLVINGLALVLSVYVMYPVGQSVMKEVSKIENVGKDTQSLLDAANTAKEPLRDFLIKHAQPRERDFFLKTLRKMSPEEGVEELTPRDFVVIIPAFTISELTVAFQIGFVIDKLGLFNLLHIFFRRPILF